MSSQVQTLISGLVEQLKSRGALSGPLQDDSTQTQITLCEAQERSVSSSSISANYHAHIKWEKNLQQRSW